MRMLGLAVALVAITACKKAEQQAPAPAPLPAPAPAPVALDAMPASVDAGTVADVELLHAVPTRIRVSSTVANPKILPAHIADSDPTTAWNSRTGELVGAWIEITLPAGVEAHELRLTAGFTATGPKGEDWFTMNPRIKKLTVTVDGKAAGTITLDVAKQDLQAFPITATDTVHLELAEIVPGSRKTWREASISEIQLWGRPPAGWVASKLLVEPMVGVGSMSLPSAPDDPCAEIEAEREKFIAEHANDKYSSPDHSYPPRCDPMTVTGGTALPAPWSVSAYCYVQDEIYGPKTCYVDVAGGSVAIPSDSQSAEMTAVVEAKDVLSASPGAELIVRVAHPAGESLSVCRSAPKVACSTPVLIGDDAWTTTPRFDKTGALVLDKASGDPPAGVLGAHPLAWPAN